MFALVDCNNFYASCERLFRPDLRGKPIIVLSSNDGCVIARSDEAKVLGIQMGVPYFQVRALCAQHKVHVFSSNFSLYGDLSRRVMSVISEAWPTLEIYSIDEAFLDLSTLPMAELDSFCAWVQKKVLRCTGIPVSIGIGPTKTLAKLANHIAKKELKIPVFNINQQMFWLSRIHINDVWGVGRQWTKKLLEQGVYTANDLASLSVNELKRRYNVTLYSTALELKGIACSDLAEYEPRKSIISSKSFSTMQTEYDALAQAVSSHCVRAWEKLRDQGSVAHYLSVSINTNRFRADLPHYAQRAGFKLIRASDDVRYLVQCAKLCLRTIFREGYHYQKVGVYFGELKSKNQVQFDLFEEVSEEQLKHTEQLMSVLNQVNKKYGTHALRLAAEGYSKPWSARMGKCSPAYTTRWADLPVASCGNTDVRARISRITLR
jgi:DNA polymerase V